MDVVIIEDDKDVWLLTSKYVVSFYNIISILQGLYLRGSFQKETAKRMKMVSLGVGWEQRLDIY